MSEDLKSLIDQDIKLAMRAKEKLKLGTLRMLKAALVQKQIDRPAPIRDNPLSNDEIIAVIQKMVRERQDAAEQFDRGGAVDRAENERLEITFLTPFLPEPLSDEAVEEMIQQAIVALNASSVKDMGAVIKVLRESIQGRADMKMVSAKVKQMLSK